MMHKQLGKVKQEINKKFGGLNIIFSGDFWQLDQLKEESSQYTKTIIVPIY